MPTPQPTRPPVLSAMPLPTAADTAPDAALPPQRYEGNAASVEAKVGEIEALGPDRSEAATSALLRSAESASLLISAAAIRGLTGRGCDRVQTLLVRMLDDSEWQRRAWAAKVLGDNGCREARPALVARSQHEQDARVGARLDEATRRLEEAKK
jgi:HEAT repeat protein